MDHGVGLVWKYTSPHPQIVYIFYGEAGRSDPLRPGPTREMQTQWAPGVVLRGLPQPHCCNANVRDAVINTSNSHQNGNLSQDVYGKNNDFLTNTTQSSMMDAG